MGEILLTLGYVRLKIPLMKRSIFITPELLVRIEQNQRYSIGNEKLGIESADEKNPPTVRGRHRPIFRMT